MSWNPIDWFGSILSGNAADAGSQTAQGIAAAQGALSNWITGLGGDIASGFEGAFVAFFGDLWDVIVGPVEVLVGALIMIWVIAWAMKNQLIQFVQVAAMVAR